MHVFMYYEFFILNYEIKHDTLSFLTAIILLLTLVVSLSRRSLAVSPPTLSRSLLTDARSLAHTHAHTYTHTHTHTLSLSHTHTHTHSFKELNSRAPVKDGHRFLHIYMVSVKDGPLRG